VTLDDLIKACESGFSSVSNDRKREGIELSSGGNDVPGDAQLRTEPAALYATEALAYGAWLDQFHYSIGERSGQSLIWVERPYVETYRITLGDQYNSFRVVRDRYVVRGTAAVEKYEPANKHDYGPTGSVCIKCASTREEILDNLTSVECPGVALTNAEYPVGPPVDEDSDVNPESVVTVELDAPLKISKEPLKVKRKAKAA
jgi:hypothetical protein